MCRLVCLLRKWILPSQPYSRHEKWCWRLRATLLTITRLPSGSPATRSTSFRSGVFGLRGRYCPPLHVALPAFGSRAAPNSRRLFVVRCAMLSRMHAVWFRAEYRPSPSGTPSRSLPHPAEFTPLILLSRFTSLRARYTSRHSRFLSAALCSALWPRVALTWRNTCLSGSHCAHEAL